MEGKKFLSLETLTSTAKFGVHISGAKKGLPCPVCKYGGSVLSVC